MAESEDKMEKQKDNTLYKYWFSYSQSDGGNDVNYVQVGNTWFPYSECTTKECETSNWEDALLVASSIEELPIKYSSYSLMLMEENRSMFS